MGLVKTVRFARNFVAGGSSLSDEGMGLLFPAELLIDEPQSDIPATGVF